MANSVVKVTDIKDEHFKDRLFLLVGEDGTVAPDQDTVENYLKQKESPTNIQIMKINKSDKQCIDISVDNVTYMPEVISEEIVKTEMDMEEVSRNLHSFRLDHDYTPYVCNPDVEMSSAEVESAKSTESTDVPASQSEPPPLIMATPQKGKGAPKVKLIQSITISPASAPKLKPEVPPLAPSEKQEESTPEPEKEEPPALEPMVPISETPDTVPGPVSKGKTKLTPKPEAKPKSSKEKTKKKSVENESEDDSYDEEDFNFEIDDNEDDSDFDYDQEQKKKTRKRTKSESKGTPRTPRRRTKSREKQEQQRETPKREKNAEKVTQDKSPEQTSVKPTDPKTPELKPEQKSEQTEATKSAEKKVVKRPKPKPILDDFALFSTPDIIRRVGGKEPTTPVTPEMNTTKPAKITQESRTKSVDVKGNRQSIESNKSEKSEKEKQPADAKTKDIPKERRLSTNEKTKREEKSKPIMEQKRSDKPNPRAAEAAENILNSDEMPSAEDIRSIILNEDTKSFTTNSLSLDTDITGTDPSNINLDGTGLDLDPTLLDNLNNDEISEDILYQVAQSLVSNPELQNAIDKGINEGVLPMAVDQNVMANQNVSLQESSQETSHKGTQIVRPNGKIVVIPPIERPTTRSRNKKKEEEKQPVHKMTHKPLDEEHVSGNELDSSGAEEEDESEDDPNKLWCICNQPHNNRFMICCDTCEEWYHGKCVNITKAMGQQMEADGKEWICLFCKDPTLKRPLAAARRIRKASRNSRLSTDSSNSNATKKQPENTVPCVVCQKQARKNSIYCSEACILSHAQAIERVVVFERATGKILTGNKAPSAANLEQWLKEHKGYEVLRSGGKVVTSKGGAFMQSKLKLIKNNDNNGVSLAVQKKGVNLGVMKHSPKQTQVQQQQQQQLLKNTIKATITGIKLGTKQLVLKESPKTKPSETQLVLSPKPRSLPATPPLSTPTKDKKMKTPPVVVKERVITTPLREKLIAVPKDKLPPKEKPAPVPSPKEKIVLPKPKPKSPKIPTPKKQENIRENVQKTVHEQLLNRLKECEDIKLSDDEVKDISVEIESQLFKCFGDTGQKYRNKYRSLIFNIKDAKNHTLWRRICEKSIGPYELVRLSPDDMASQELAKWRENEAKHSLDMIKKSELELLNCNRQYVLKTHKGEQVVEDERVDLTDNAEVIKSLTEGSTLETMDPKSDPKDRDKKGGSKHAHKDRDRKSSREKEYRSHRSRSSSRERSRKRSRSRERRRGDHKKHSRDRDRDKHRKSSSHRSSRHKKDMISTTDKLDKKSKEILESLVDNKIVLPLEDKLWKHVSQDDIVPAEESDSDHEPTSTVTIPTPPRAAEEDVSAQITETKTQPPPSEKEKSSNETSERSTSPPPKTKPVEIWRGIINMVDVAQISITAHEVSGECGGLGKELAENLDIVGRISPDTVWDYIGKMKCSNSKGISLIRLKATNIEERMPYLALYSYLSSRDRLGVVKSTNKAVKDFYIYPLAPQKPIPQVLLPINGPGFEESRPALLLGIIVRDKRKARLYTDSGHTPELYTKKSKTDTAVPPLPTIPPPVVVAPPLPRSYTPPPMKDPRLKIPVLPVAPVADDEGDEPYSPGDSSPEAPPPLMDQPTLVPPGLGASIGALVPAAPFSIPGTTILPSNTFEIQRQVEELNKRIEAEKSEITSMTKNIVSASTEIGSSALANIALPSNLQQILDSIKTIGETSSDSSPPTLTEPPPQTDLTIPLMIPKTFVRPLNIAPQQLDGNTIPLNLPSKPKAKPISSAVAEEKPSSVLGSLSEEELIRKAAEMLGEEDIKVKKKGDKEPPPKRAKHEISLPPVPGLENDAL